MQLSSKPSTRQRTHFPCLSFYGVNVALFVVFPGGIVIFAFALALAFKLVGADVVTFPPKVVVGAAVVVPPTVWEGLGAAVVVPGGMGSPVPGVLLVGLEVVIFMLVPSIPGAKGTRVELVLGLVALIVAVMVGELVSGCVPVVVGAAVPGCTVVWVVGAAVPVDVPGEEGAAVPGCGRLVVGAAVPAVPPTST